MAALDGITRVIVVIISIIATITAIITLFQEGNGFYSLLEKIFKFDRTTMNLIYSNLIFQAVLVLIVNIALIIKYNTTATGANNNNNTVTSNK